MGLVFGRTKFHRLKPVLLKNPFCKKNGWRGPHPGQPRISLAPRESLLRSLIVNREDYAVKEVPHPQLRVACGF
jgi:hypothetical protein